MKGQTSFEVCSCVFIETFTEQSVFIIF